jgi:hypothetical protein
MPKQRNLWLTKLAQSAVPPRERVRGPVEVTADACIAIVRRRWPAS